MTMIIDGDQHIHEPRSMWRERIDPAFREDALAIEDDERGWAWLTWRGRRLYLAEVQRPGRAGEIGEARQRLARGETPLERYDEALPPAYTDPKARVAALDEWNIDACVCFPNFGLLWEDMLASDPPVRRANLRAWNRWAAEVAAEGSGRLHPVAHLVLDDDTWVAEELRALERAGIRLAMVAPAPAGGRALSEPALDALWAAFVHHGVSPVFHVGGFRKPFDPVWYAADPEPVDKVLDSALLWVPAALALAAMAVHGTFERHPGLRVGVVELTAHWLPPFLLMLDGGFGFYAARHGAPLTRLPLRPGEYLLRQVRVAALAYEMPARLAEQAGDVFMFGSDWPHAEGIAEPLAGYERCVEELAGEARRRLMGGNMAWLLRLEG